MRRTRKPRREQKKKILKQKTVDNTKECATVEAVILSNGSQ